MSDTALQDGLLEWYLSVAGQSDANVEARLEREAFDVLERLINSDEVKRGPVVSYPKINPFHVGPIPTGPVVTLPNETPSDHDLALPDYWPNGLQRRTP